MALKYRLKSTIVEAVQYKGSITFSSRPDWLVDAFLAYARLIGALRREDDDSLTLRINNNPSGSHVLIKPTDWIVQGEAGNLWHMTDEDFAKSYEVAAELQQ